VKPIMDEEKKHRIPPEILQNARNLREMQTSAETKLWTILRNLQLDGYKFRRQKPIGRFIVDFFCNDAKLVIEIDGDTHAGREGYDINRTKWLENEGYQVIRFTNDDISTNLENVAREILKQCNDRKASV
jgi:very-short-patch-repair endonuclease